MKGINYSKLKGRLWQRGMTQGELASKIHLTESTMSIKLSGKSDFKQGEIAKIVEVLDIPCEEINAYFFCGEV